MAKSKYRVEMHDKDYYGRLIPFTEKVIYTWAVSAKQACFLAAKREGVPLYKVETTATKIDDQKG